MKIVYCLNSIRYLGGIQRVTIVKANALAEIEGNEVYVVVTDNKEGVCVEPLSTKVNLVDLDINHYKNDQNRSYISNLIVGLFKRFKQRKVLKRHLNLIQPDIVISVGTSEKYMIPTMSGRSWKIVREFHFARNYRVSLADSRLKKTIGHLSNFIEFNIGKYLLRWDRIVVLSNEDRLINWQNWENVTVIPNPTSFISCSVSPLNSRTVISLGRLDYQKNYSSLIKAFRKVAEKHPDWELKIYGTGRQKALLQKLIEELNLQENVKLMSYTSDVKSCLLESSMFALSSINEGFPLVLVEAMECGVPVVSYQCPCGPKDIITDGVDGFLFPVNDEKAMADRICRLIENDELRRKMGAAAKETAKKYHIENITKQWMQLFNELIHS